ncbi:MAG: MMPL family transporter, partial [Candidatus Dormibacteraeota bacterium]|nr:MMPL family transporter [Candidatus Dormibacteraeota bacterium]MBO0762182.1 MMPL family transporter [Candidatus Dormibacteraeota bacterium]
QQLYAQPRSQLPPEVQQALRDSTGSHIVVLTAVTPDPSTSDGARQILSQIRSQEVPGGDVLVTGETAIDQDLVDFVLDHVPAAVGFVIATTLVILFLLTGSVLLPIKAVLSNLVSISASFGALVWIFQDGHLAGALGFTPQSIDPAVPVLLFATVFGLSMDYEVLLVTRIQEAYRATGDNARAVVSGLARSGRLITAAAAIMVVVFLAFASSQIVLIKAIGLGLSLAILLDATLIRALVVPSVMRLLGDANWWAPKPLRWVHDRLSGRSIA